jgi:hypothetical protein
MCLHDPLWTHHYTTLDEIKSNKRLGISCTGIYLFSDWVNKHPSRKVILHRPLEEVNASLDKMGLPMISESQHKRLDYIEGTHVQWTDIFHRPKDIYEYLTGLEFDEERHKFLMDIEMQPRLQGLSMDKALTKRLIDELGELT